MIPVVVGSKFISCITVADKVIFKFSKFISIPCKHSS